MSSTASLLVKASKGVLVGIGGFWCLVCLDCCRAGCACVTRANLGAAERGEERPDLDSLISRVAPP